MKKDQILWLLIILISLSGCRSKKIVTEEFTESRDSTEVRIERVVDTVFKDRVIERVKPVYSEIIVEKPCDSLGNINPINYNIGSGSNNSQVFTRDGKLYINQHIDSMESRFEKEYRSRWKQDSLDLRNTLLRESSSEKEVVRYVYPWWWWCVLIVGSLLLLLRVLEKYSILRKIKSLILK